MNEKRVIVALDEMSLEEALDWVDRLNAGTPLFKVGLSTSAASSWQAAIGGVRERGGQVFADPKFLEIKKQVDLATRSIVECGPWMINCHALGGREMMESMLAVARSTADEFDRAQPLVIAVTLLTSLSYADLVAFGFYEDDLSGLDEAERKITKERRFRAIVLRLARLAQDCGLDGVVASGKHAPAIRKACGLDFKIVIPGVRPVGAATHEQKQVVTPAVAMEHGDFIVMGRPLLEAADPLAALDAANHEVNAALAAKAA